MCNVTFNIVFIAYTRLKHSDVPEALITVKGVIKFVNNLKLVKVRGFYQHEDGLSYIKIKLHYIK